MRGPEYVLSMLGAFKHVLLAAALFVASGALAAGEKPLTVVELFTSQGCSSCPPADALIGELAERDDILALSHHVDYWDYLGWEDTLAQPVNTERQRAYARGLGLQYVYTPQVVIQGAYQATGSHRQAVLDQIGRAQPDNPLPVTIAREGEDKMVISIGAGTGGGKKDAAVWLAMLDREHSASVGGGENRGRVVRTFNAVRSFTRVGTWNGEAMTIVLPAPSPAMSSEADACAVIVQAGDAGRILGAARLSLSSN